MKKSIFLILTMFAGAAFLNAQNTENLKNFIKGNLIDKTAAVRAAGENEVEALSIKAITFAIENKPVLGDDRDLAALAVSGILSIPQNFADRLSEREKSELSYDFLLLYNLFNDETVKIAVLNRIAKLNIPKDKFIETLNSYILNCNPEKENHSLMASSIISLGQIGNSESFNILFKCTQKKNWNSYSNELEESIGLLSINAEQDLLDLLRASNTAECRKLFEFVINNKKNIPSFRAEISENILARTIYIYENNGNASSELISLEIDSFNVLKELKWTRASESCIKFFDTAVKQYENNEMSEKDFISVIEGIAETSPMDSVSRLSVYLSNMNRKMESTSTEVSEPVVLALINTLGAIGDKNAFDSLLAVTYYNYSDSVIATARNALAKLKW